MMVALAFLHTWLLWGMALGSIPIIIHLFHRRKFHTVMWGAMSFLLSSSKLKSRRLKILQLLLLLTRILVICFLVLALARPHLTGALFAGFLSGDKTVSVILLDTSFSMAARTGDTSFERAKRAIEEITSNLRRGDSAALITFSNKAVVEARNVSDFDAFERIVANVPVSDGSTSIHLGLADAFSILRGERASKKEIYLITDGRKNGWDVEKVAEWERIDSMISNMKSTPRIHIIDVGSPEIDNSCLSGIDIEAADSSTAGKYQISVEAQAYGSALSQVPVSKFFVDDMSEEQSRIIGSDYENGISEGEQPFKLEGEGFHYGRVELLETDMLASDNSRYFSVCHRKGLPVLCVEGLSKGRLFRSSADLIRIALAPEKDMAGNIIIPSDYTNIMVPELVSMADIYEKRLQDYEIVILCNAGSLQERDYESLKYFLSRGGGLAIFLGDGIEPEKYNSLYENDDKTFIPARIGSLNGRPSARDRKPGDPEYVLSEFDYRHPVMKNFEGAQDGDLTLFKFYAYYSVDIDESNPDINVISRFNNGDPFIVERKVGRGKVIMLTSEPAIDWSNMGPRPAFLPLVHHMTRYLAGDTSKRYNLSVGESISYPLESSEKPVTIINPVGTAFRLQPKMMGDTELKLPFVDFDETSIAGIYTLYPEADKKDNDETEEKDKIYFAVNPDPIESDLTPLDPKVMKGMLKNIDVNFIKYGPDFGVKIRESRYGKEIWRYIMLAVLVLLITESVLAYMIDRT